MKLVMILLSASFSVLAQIPFERDVPRVEEYYFVGGQSSVSGHFDYNFGGDFDEKLYPTGFSLYNYGPNDIVPEQPSSTEMISRSYQFTSDDGSRRENYLWITDSNGSGRISDYMETMLVFLPRHNQFEIREEGKFNEVILPTGESVTFYAREKVIYEGVLSEEKVDLEEDRNIRKFAQVSYHGKGVVIRSDVRASDPRLVKKSKVQKVGLDDCIVDTKVFWTQESYPKFQFIDDSSAYQAIIDYCGVAYLPEL